MPRRSYDEDDDDVYGSGRWGGFPESKPIPVDGGVVTSKKRGAMAATWWSQRFTTVLESYGLGSRMQRGRRYARAGQVLSVEVASGRLAARVQGSRSRPYQVIAGLPAPTATQWERITDAMRAKVGFVARLLDGDMPPELEELFTATGVALFPKSYGALRAQCTCPDPENPCKHIAAVLYVFADRLDVDPWLLLAWRGRTRDQLLGPLAQMATEAHAATVAPWWPFPPGPLRVSEGSGAEDQLASPDSTTVLDSLEPPALITPAAVEALRSWYPTIVTGTTEGA